MTAIGTLVGPVMKTKGTEAANAMAPNRSPIIPVSMMMIIKARLLFWHLIHLLLVLILYHRRLLNWMLRYRFREVEVMAMEQYLNTSGYPLLTVIYLIPPVSR